MIIDAIKSAQTKHALYFLLTAYVETLAFVESIPEKVRKLPIRGKADVRMRWKVIQDLLRGPLPDRQVGPKIEEAADISVRRLHNSTSSMTETQQTAGPKGSAVLVPNRCLSCGSAGRAATRRGFI